MLEALHTCDVHCDRLIRLGLLFALLHGFQHLVDHFEVQPPGQPGLEEAHMHQGAAAQPLLTPQGGMRYPPDLITIIIIKTVSSQG